MDESQLNELAAWITEAGLAGRNETTTLTGFCEHAGRIGLPITRAIVLADTLHPIYQGRAFRWNRDKDTTVLTEYGRTDEDLGRWQRSPFFRLEESGDAVLRRRLTAEVRQEFSIFPELIDAGMTDYIARVDRFATEARQNSRFLAFANGGTAASRLSRGGDGPSIAAALFVARVTFAATLTVFYFLASHVFRSALLWSL